MHPLRNILNKMTWDRREDAKNYDVYFIHRGDLEDTRKINASLIRKVGRSWFTYTSGESDETLIPFHRVKRIVNVETGRAIWTARPRKGT